MAEPVVSPFQSEIARIRATYAEFGATDAAKIRWAPFNSSEAEVRTQQALGFSTLMREAGFLDLEGLRILDLGCGSGRHLRQYLDMGAEPDALFGIDLDEPALARGRKLSPHLHFASASGDTIDFPDESFDLVSHYFAFSSVPGAEFRLQLAREVMRVLKPGGLFFWWDMLHMAIAAGGSSERLDVRELFPNDIVAERFLGAKPAPSDSLRPARFVHRLLAPIADALAYPPIFQAALMRRGRTGK